MGKKLILLAVLALALPLAAFASSNVDFTNSGGTLSGTNSGLSLSGSTLIAVNGLYGGGLITGTNLGSMTFSTGALTSGSLQMGGTFAAGGSFSTLPNGTHNYTLTGVVSGSFPSGFQTNGVTVQLTINTGKGYFNGSTQISSGDTNIVVPEPGTLSLLGTGLISLGGVIRRKLKA
jgi:PEP-CTERM motif